MDKKINYFLLVLLLLAFLIRVIGITPGHPPDHPDEPMSYSSAIEMFTHGDLNPRRFDYPSGVPLLHYLFYKQFLLPGASLGAFFKEPSSLITAAINYPAFLREFLNVVFGKNGLDALIWSRFLTALLGALSVFLTYLIGKRLFNTATGIFASIFLAVNYRHVLSSHLALSDIPNGFFVLLAFYACVLLLEKNTAKRYLLCGLLIGLSISMKYQVLALLPFLFVHLLWAIKKRKITELFNRYFIFSLILIPIIFVFLNPYLLLNLETALPIVQNVSLRYGAGAYRFNFYPLFYLYHWGIGMLPFVAILIGFPISLVKSPMKTLLVLTYVGPFLFIFLYYMTGGTYIRNFTTVIPFLMLFSGYLYGVLANFLYKRINRKIALGLLAFLLIAINYNSIKDSFMVSFAYTKEWDRDLLATWATRNIPEGSKVMNDNVGLPSTIEKPMGIIPWGIEEGNSITELSHKNVDFAVLNINWNQIYLFWFDTPYQELFLYGGIPYPKLKDSYHGLLLSEYLSYVVFEAYKPWQAPDHAYIVIKVPQKPHHPGKKIKTFNFNDGLEEWKFYEFHSKKKVNDLEFDTEEGNEEKGSLKLTGTGSKPMSRLISPFVKITPGNVYTIEGFLKAGIEIKSNLRDGFLRVDFYKDDNVELLAQGGIAKGVSGRVFGSSRFEKKEIIITAPQKSQYLTVSIQRTNPALGYTYWLDDLNIFESKEPLQERLKEIPYIKPTVPDDVLFPNSIY